jgi:hypothetical protein
MTSIQLLSDRKVSVEEFAIIMRSRFAEVFGYDELVTVDASELWKLVASNPSELAEAQRNA